MNSDTKLLLDESKNALSIGMYLCLTFGSLEMTSTYKTTEKVDTIPYVPVPTLKKIMVSFLRIFWSNILI